MNTRRVYLGPGLGHCTCGIYNGRAATIASGPPMRSCVPTRAPVGKANPKAVLNAVHGKCPVRVGRRQSWSEGMKSPVALAGDPCIRALSSACRSRMYCKCVSRIIINPWRACARVNRVSRVCVCVCVCVSVHGSNLLVAQLRDKLVILMGSVSWSFHNHFGVFRIMASFRR